MRTEMLIVFVFTY